MTTDIATDASRGGLAALGLASPLRHDRDGAAHGEFTVGARVHELLVVRGWRNFVSSSRQESAPGWI